MIKSQRKPPGVGTPTPVLCVEFEFRGTLANIKVELKKPNTQKANKQKAKAQCLKRKTLENCFTLFRFGLGFSARRAIYVLCIIPHTHIHLARRQIIRWTLKAECEMAGTIFFYFFFFGSQGIRVLSFPAVRGECNAFPLCSFLHSHFTENRQTHKSLGFVFRAGNTRKYANKIP